MEIIKGVITAINGSFLTLAAGDELIKAYIKKGLQEKIPVVGSEVGLYGLVRQFRDGNNYFVIRQFLEEKNQPIKARYYDKNEHLSKLEKVHNFFLEKCGAGKGIKVIYEDSQTGETLEKTLNRCDWWDIKIECQNNKYYLNNSFNFERFNGINLAAKKYGSKIEAKIKIEYLEIIEVAEQKKLVWENWATWKMVKNLGKKSVLLTKLMEWPKTPLETKKIKIIIS